ncbi:MAG: 4-diphosphocytidyl-2-C-methyl-D-erythritol kinase [bacterium]|nr:4-diphosphocytidyl-2-C-methyl-D-erythritol kinase [bacterium]
MLPDCYYPSAMEPPTPPTALRLRACAKVNFYLRILGTRPDGYHNLATLFQAIELADTLEFTLEKGRDQIHLWSTQPDFPDGPGNLIHQAWRLLLDRYPSRIASPGLRCRIDKVIPMQAGLGGGSADAAATLVALNHLWQLGLAQPELRDLALELGSDVPFPLIGGTAFGTGRGEALSSLSPIPTTHLLLLLPPSGCSTAAAFGWWDAAHPQPEESPSLTELQQLWSTAIEQGTWPQFLHNDFEDLICSRHPDIAAVRDALRNRGLPTVLTGSGSALVGVCASYDEATAIAQAWVPVAGERLILTATRSGPGIW